MLNYDPSRYSDQRSVRILFLPEDMDASTVTFTDTPNYGAQIGQNHGWITNNFDMSGTGKREPP